MIEVSVYASTVAGRIPMAVYLGLLVVFVIGVMGMLLWKGIRTGGRYASVLALLEWMTLVLCATVIFREGSAERGFRLIPFSSYWDFGPHGYLLEAVAEKLLNVALFVPVGLLIGCEFKGMTWKKVLVIEICLSVAIELMQFVFGKGLCEVDDVMHNTLGCLIGYGIYVVIRKIRVKCCIE